MRFFFRRRIPPVNRVLLVESGSRWILEKAHERMRSIFPQARYDLCTCFPGEPAPGGFDHVFRVTEARGSLSRLKMALAMRRLRPAAAALLFTGEPIMLPWKLLLMLLLPSKVLVVNENADFFWLDWGNRAIARQFLVVRAGVNGAEFLRAACRLLLLPLVFVFLAVNALFAYAVRWARLLSWRFCRRQPEDT